MAQLREGLLLSKEENFTPSLRATPPHLRRGSPNLSAARTGIRQSENATQTALSRPPPFGRRRFCRGLPPLRPITPFRPSLPCAEPPQRRRFVPEAHNVQTLLSREQRKVLVREVELIDIAEQSNAAR